MYEGILTITFIVLYIRDCNFRFTFYENVNKILRFFIKIIVRFLRLRSCLRYIIFLSFILRFRFYVFLRFLFLRFLYFFYFF